MWHSLSQNLDLISPIVSEVNAKHKQITIDLAQKDDNGNSIRNAQNQIDFGDNIEKANKRWEDIMNQNVEVELIPILLEDIQEYGLDANMMKPLLGTLVVE